MRCARNTTFCGVGHEPGAEGGGEVEAEVDSGSGIGGMVSTEDLQSAFVFRQLHYTLNTSFLPELWGRAHRHHCYLATT